MFFFSIVSECGVGYYGEGCTEECSLHCTGLNNTCHHVNGTCDLGCNPGYQGHLCNQGKTWKKPTYFLL